MPEINQIEGPAGGPDHVRRQDRSVPDDKFKKEMEPKVTKVTESDADQEAKKKKKSKQEEGIEGEEEVTAAPPSEGSLPSPFSLEASKKSISPSELQAGEGKISPLESARPTEPNPMAAFVEKPPAYTPPSSEEIEDHSGMWGETAEIVESPPSAQPESQLPSAPPPTTPDIPQVQTPEPKRAELPEPQPSAQPQQSSQQPTAATPSTPQSAQTQKPTLTTPTTASKTPTQTHTTPDPAPAQKGVIGVPEHQDEKAGEIAPLLKGAIPTKPLTPPAQVTQEKIEEEAEEAQGIVPVTPTLSTTGASLEPDQKNERKLEGGTTPTGTVIPSEMPMPLEGGIAPVETPLPSYMTMRPEIIDLFEKMAGVMTVMTSEGLTETSITLNAPQFASSVFYGTQIIIQEFSTAPKAFNIQIKGTPAAVAAFQGNTNDLMAAFQHGQYAFRVNRLDTSLLEEKPLFKRKEKISGDTDDQPE